MDQAETIWAFVCKVPVPHSGGQECVLQGCVRARAGEGHIEGGVNSSLWYITFLRQRTVRLCWPPPHDTLHALHLPSDQLTHTHTQSQTEETS
ncbi:hypothetical protein AMELA_G00030640 [Ameiurus melas]|uniref:Uncharacterized protein n=1 Tax=Ameiurus melas TaxID=219545 RepID=A0A7J6B8W6_AMEME|nr:hypothetical protein AMELA_G00030640 [Ameiurus melas]